MVESRLNSDNIIPRHQGPKRKLQASVSTMHVLSMHRSLTLRMYIFHRWV